MASNDSSNRSGGIGFLGMLGILFIGLKLAGFIDWPWVWVLSPLWGWLALIILCVVVYVIADMLEKNG